MPISILDPINESIHVEIAQAHLLLVISLMNPCIHILHSDVLGRSAVLVGIGLVSHLSASFLDRNTVQWAIFWTYNSLQIQFQIFTYQTFFPSWTGETCLRTTVVVANFTFNWIFPLWAEATFVSMWLFREQLWSQMSHLNGLFSSWTDAACVFICFFREKLYVVINATFEWFLLHIKRPAYETKAGELSLCASWVDYICIQQSTLHFNSVN